MVSIEINNSFSQVKNMTPEVYRGLRKLLSYEADPAAKYYTGGFARTKYLIDAKGFFPTGLLRRVRVHLEDAALLGDITDKRIKPKAGSIDLTGDEYPWQVQATARALIASRGIISATTGSGKSRVIQLISRSLDLKTLVVVPSLEIKLQLKAVLKDLKNVTIENIDSKALNSAKGFDCLIIDECHHVAAKTYQRLNKTAWSGVYYRFMLTATPFRNQVNEQLLFEGIAGQVIYELNYKDAVKNGYICPIEAFYHKLPKVEVTGHTWAQVYSELVVNNEHRNLVIAKTLLNLNAANVFTLCLVKEVAHGETLASLTGMPFANGKDETTRQYIKEFNEGRVKTLIGTTGILGEGVDTKPCEYVVIAGLGKAKSAFMQQVGRSVRRHPGKETAKVILFKDPSHKFTLSHFNAQKNILLVEYGISVLALD